MRRKKLDDSKAKRREAHIRAEAELDALALELLEPYRALLDCEPIAPVVRAILDNLPPREARRAILKVLDGWTDSLVCYLQDLDRVESDRALRLLLAFLADRYPKPLLSARYGELKGQGHDPADLPVESRWEAVWLAGLRSRERVIEQACADLPDSLGADRAFRSALNETATEVLTGAGRDRRDVPEHVPLSEHGIHEAEAEAFLIADSVLAAGLTAAEERASSLRAEGYSGAEIGAEMDCSESTVWVHLHNARRKIRAAI